MYAVCLSYRFIKQEAEEKANEIMVAAEEEVGLFAFRFDFLSMI